MNVVCCSRDWRFKVRLSCQNEALEGIQGIHSAKTYVFIQKYEVSLIILNTPSYLELRIEL